jgi:hypothetical protein
MKDNDLPIRTVWVVFDFETNARELFHVPQRYSIVPSDFFSVRVAGLSEYVCLEGFAANAPISVKLDATDEVGCVWATVPTPTILSTYTDRR